MARIMKLKNSITLPPGTYKLSGQLEVPQGIRLVALAYSAKDFGAIGDGKTDDTKAIQLAINQISNPDR